MRVSATIFAALYYALALFLAYSIIASANTTARLYAHLSDYETAGSKADKAVRDTLAYLTFGIYKGATERKDERDAAKRCLCERKDEHDAAKHKCEARARATRMFRAGRGKRV